MRGPRKQHGAALLLFAAILILGFAAFLYQRLGKWGEATPTRQNVNGAVLQQAKQALIGYIAKEVLDLTEDVPGRFPCPESPSDAGTTNEGRAAGNCSPTGTNRTVGRLPWRTLGLDKLVDASAEPLWYAVSQNWVMVSGFPPTPPLINDGTAGQFSFDGTSDVVAVIFAPGKAISTSPNANQLAAGCVASNQFRSDRSHVPSGGNPDYRDYLECLNAASPIGTSFGVSVVDNATNVVLNDQAITITAKEVLNAIQGPLAERLQRTVAPLLSEYSGLWPSGNFMPYAVAFSPPEFGLPLAQYCGPTATTPQKSEGLLPLAPNSGSCVSTWNNVSISGSVTSLGCTTLPSTNVQCTFSYYRLTGLGAVLFGGGATSTDVTIEATAPHAAASFRKPLTPSDVIVPPGLIAQAATFTPRTDGDAKLSLQIRVTGTQLCDNILLGLVCNLLPGVLATSTNVSVQFPQLGTTVPLTGNQLSAAVMNNNPSLDLLVAFPAGTVLPGSPTVTLTQDDPHYWFLWNEWYRYTYYAIAPGTSAAQIGSNLTVNLFPSAYGSSTDKHFVLTLMGPPVNGQTRSATAALNQYVEGDNAATGASPRTFAYQVFSVSGNDRVATCPFTSGFSICD
ncbi:MAG: hypothetical protein ACREU5_08200 [Burkholderiales bacterium]